MGMDLITFDNVYFQYQQNLITEEFWSNLKGLYLRSMRDPYERSIRLNTAIVLPASEVIAELALEIENE